MSSIGSVRPPAVPILAARRIVWAPAGALLLGQDRGESGERQRRAEQVVVRQFEGVVPPGAAAPPDLDRHGDRPRPAPQPAADPGGPILAPDADRRSGAGEPERVRQRGHRGLDPGLLHRDRDGAEAGERVAEGVHLAGRLIEVGHGAAGHEDEIAADQGGAHRAAGGEARRPFFLRGAAPLRETPPGAQPPGRDLHAELAEQRGEQPMGFGAQAARRHRRADRQQLASVGSERGPGGRRRVEGGESFVGKTEGRPGSGEGSGGGRLLGETHHLLERGDPADRIPRKRERVGHGAEQPPVHIDRAAAHPLQDPGVGQRSAGQVGEHDAPARHRALQHPDDLDAEGLDLVAGENGAPLADHPGANLGERKDRRLGGDFRRDPREEEEEGERSPETVDLQIPSKRRESYPRGFDSSRKESPRKPPAAGRSQPPGGAPVRRRAGYRDTGRRTRKQRSIQPSYCRVSNSPPVRGVTRSGSSRFSSSLQAR